MSKVNLTSSDVHLFAEWSTDRNPIHVDKEFARGSSFGQTIAHGMLTVLKSLQAVECAQPLCKLQIEFRNAVGLESELDVDVTSSDDHVALSAILEGQSALNIEGSLHPIGERPREQCVWAEHLDTSDQSRTSPADLNPVDLEAGRTVSGAFRTAAPPVELLSPAVSPCSARVLALCSYIIGMELPGLRSLFTTATIEFDDLDDPSDVLKYQARVVRFDSVFRVLDVQLEVATPAGQRVARADLRSYVRFAPHFVNPEAIQSRLGETVDELQGKVALVVGGTRGLGAEITAALSLAGAHVYASYHNNAQQAADLQTRLSAVGCHLETIRGDAAEPNWCTTIHSKILADHGRLDYLVLNACTPIEHTALTRNDAGAFNAYMQQNLPLVDVPLSCCAESLQQFQGQILYISSIAVEEAPTGFGAYVALKRAAESIVTTAVEENLGMQAVIVRPPKLLTSWNDSPVGVVGAIPPEWVAVHLVNSLVAAPEATSDSRVRLLREFPEPIMQRVVEHSPSGDAFPIVASASFTADGLKPGVAFWSRELNVGLNLKLAPYAQTLRELIDPASLISTNTDGMNVVLLRVRDWLRELAEEQLHSSQSLDDYLESTLQDFVRAFRTHRSRPLGETVLLICPSGTTHASEIDERIRATEERLLTALEGLSGLKILRAEDFHTTYQVSEEVIHDELRDKIAHVPYQDSYLHFLSTLIARLAFRRIHKRKKVVVVDCDNTLWNGVVGEAGPEGIAFEPQHLELQRRLIQLSESGVLICLCSKNEEHDVWSVFDGRDDFLLRREHLVASKINWSPKSANLAALAAQLNLGIDSFVFLDDNPVECAEVRANCPEVLTLQWPRETQTALRLLAHTWELDCFDATSEDRRRTQMYQEESQRQAAREDTLTFREFIDSLQLQISLDAVTDDDEQRASQLTLRTNQFNFTTIRREQSDIQELRRSDRYDLRLARVKDRFGDYGIVGLVIVEHIDNIFKVDTFLLSCRVLGRGVEHHLAAEIGRMALDAGVETVELRVDFTKRNAPARKFVESISESDHCDATEERLVCRMTAEALAGVRFEPTDEPVATSTTTAQAKPTSVVGDGLRSREQQIEKSARTLGDLAAIVAAIDGRPITTATSSSDASADIEQIVHEAFAKQLKVSVDHVREVDQIEALGCDSFKIVEITVALIARFPSLPSTLLFEHATVSDIVRAIRTHTKEASPRVHRQQAQPRVEVTSRPRSDVEIAVVGMAARCAGANNVDELWELLNAGQTAVRPVPQQRDVFLRPLKDTRPHWAGLIDDAAGFDAEFFGISPREAEYMDPQLRMMLEVAWNALEDAGATGQRHDPLTGVFIGVMYGDYSFPANLLAQAENAPFKCWENFSLANRISHLFGFRGPSLAVDTACSSSGTAMHLACRALANGECRRAIVGGVNLILDADRFELLGRLGILTPTNTCQPFGSESNGTVLGEGVGAVVLRPLQDALDQGDTVLGVIKGIGVSTGNGTVGFTAPEPTAQAEAIRRALSDSGIDPRAVSYVETHGTGTQLGDPIEVRGLSLAYQDAQFQRENIVGEPDWTIGSVKPNIGHLEAGAFVMGLIKTLLQLRHRRLVPSICSDEYNATIPFDSLPFAVQREGSEWKPKELLVDGQLETLPRTAGLSSFGVGGSNVHCIIQEAPPCHAPQVEVENRPLHLCLLSASHPDALNSVVDQTASVLETNSDIHIADACFSMSVDKDHRASRLAFIVTDRDDAVEKLNRWRQGDRSVETASGQVRRSGSTPGISFLFTGQGAQYPGMAKSLYETHSRFRSTVDECAAILDEHLDRPLLDVLFADPDGPDASLIHQTRYTQPALFVVEYALADLWRSWGVEPDFVMGHSIGEHAAACFAGVASLEDSLRLVAARGRLMNALPNDGAMASIMAGHKEVKEALQPFAGQAVVAAFNGPRQVVISGEEKAVTSVMQSFEERGTKVTRLNVSHAFHSPLMEPMLEEYREVAQSITFKPPQTRFISSVTGSQVETELMQPDYWVRQVVSPVQFTQAMSRLHDLDTDIYLETGPHPVMLGMGRQCPVDGEDRRQWIGSLRRKQDDWRTLFNSLATLFVSGVKIDWAAVNGPYSRQRVRLPHYPFQHKRHWIRVNSQADASFNVSSHSRGEPELFTLKWRSDSHPAPTAIDGRQRWVICEDQGGVAEQFISRLQTGGVDAACTLIRTGDQFREVNENCFELNPTNPDAWRLLWTTLADDPEPLTRVINFWPLDSTPHETSVAYDRLCNQSLLGTAHLLATRHEQPSPARVWVVTQNAAGCSPEIESAPETDASGGAVTIWQAPLWAYGRTAALEFPETWGGHVDLSSSVSDEELDGLISALTAPSDEDQIVLRGDRRLVPRLVRQEDVTTGPLSLSASASYLITGGLGALGMHVARWLANNGAGRIILISRRGMDSPAAKSILEEMETLGSTAQVVAADVSQRAELEQVLANIDDDFPLRGVFHAAGVDEQSTLSEMTAEQVDRVLSAKVLGGFHLHELTSSLPLDLFVCFSSVAATLGSAGHAHYAAANGFLDGLSQHRLEMGLPTLCLNWGPWAGGGMASETELRRFESIGNYGLQPEQAIECLATALGANLQAVNVAQIDWDRFGGVYTSRRPRPILNEILSSRSTTKPPSQGPEWIKHLQQVSEDSRPERLQSLIREEAAKTLGYSSGSDISLESTFSELGMDSVIAVEFANRISRKTGLGSLASVFDHPSVSELSKHLEAEIQLSQLLAHRANGSAVPTSVENQGWASLIADLPADEYVPLLTNLVREEAAKLLGYPAASDVPGDRPFDELGMDSVLSVEFANRIDRRLGVSAARMSVYESPNIDRFAEKLFEALDRSSTQSTVSKSTSRLEGYSEQVEHEVFAFQQLAWPHRRADWIEPRWKWMFVKSAQRIGIEPRIWLYRDGGNIVAHCGAIPVNLKVKDETIQTSYLVETMVLEEYRAKAVGSYITIRIGEELPFALSLGQTAQVRKILEGLGWKNVLPLNTATFLIRPEQVLKGKLPGPLRHAAGAGVRIRNLTMTTALPSGWQRREIERFDVTHDRLWEAMSTTVGCCVVRDASYLNWKYVEQPGQHFIRLEILQNSEPVAMAILKLTEPDQNYRYRRAFLLDVVARLDDSEQLQNVVRAAIQAAREAGADSLTCLHSHPALTQALKASGFLMREPTRYLLVLPGLPHHLRADVLVEANWLVTHGDSDIDRPW